MLPDMKASNNFEMLSLKNVPFVGGNTIIPLLTTVKTKDIKKINYIFLRERIIITV